MESRVVFTLLGLLSLTALLVPSAADGLVVVDVDSEEGTELGYSRTLGLGERAVFHWWLTNPEGSGGEVYVSISVPLADGGWSLELSDDYLVLQPGEAAMVVLTVTPLEWGNGISMNASVRFTFTDGDGGSQMVARAVSAHVEVEEPLVEGEDDDGLGEFLLFGSLPMDLEILRIPDNQIMRFTIQLLLWLIVAGVLAWVINPIMTKVARRTRTRIDDIVIDIIQRPIFFLVVIYGATDSLHHMTLPGMMQTQLTNAGTAISFLIVVWMVYRLFKDVLIQFTKEYSKTTDTDLDEFVIVPLVEKVGVVLIGVITIVYVMSFMGIDPSALVAGSVVIGMVLGLALQDTLSNFFAGITLIIDQPFKTGDTIVLENGDFCRVERIGMRSVKLYHLFDHEHVIVPNNVIAGQNIVNASLPDTMFKVKVKVGVAYGTDARRVEKLLLRIARRHKETLKDPDHEPFIRMSFNDSSIDFTLTCWVDDFNNHWRVGYEIKLMIYEAFAREGIEIPFPQRDLNFPRTINVSMAGAGDQSALSRKQNEWKEREEFRSRKRTVDKSRIRRRGVEGDSE